VPEFICSQAGYDVLRCHVALAAPICRDVLGHHVAAKGLTRVVTRSPDLLGIASASHRNCTKAVNTWTGLHGCPCEVSYVVSTYLSK